ncbi:MAG: cyanophycin synthetase, partial [Nitriliruptorales bacterium]|nr:cyanophycin synthetase [Nitriliruptorales bacterium]
VLTDIDLDHPQLGDTPDAIAREKSGIIKDRSRVVTARQTDGVMKVIEAAAADHDAPLRVAGRDFAATDRRVAVGGQQLGLRIGDRIIDEVFLPLFGAHQAENAAVALAAFASFLGEETFAKVDDDVIRQGFGAVEAPGRLEIVHRDPTVVLDGAHNPHGAQALAAALEESFGFRNLVLVIACLDDKNITGIVDAFRDHANHVVVLSAPTHRAASREKMAKVADEVWAGTGVIIEQADTIADALEKATGVAGEGDGVLVTGSLYTVGAARDHYLPLSEDASGAPDEGAS